MAPGSGEGVLGWGAGRGLETHLVTSDPFWLGQEAAALACCLAWRWLRDDAPPWSLLLKALVGRAPVLLVMLRHAW